MNATRTDDSGPSRVASGDGTEIAYWSTGEGPPLVLVHGTTADHTRWRPLLPYLEPYATVHAMDRRGRGASGDGPDYEVVREFEDVGAVVDAVAEASGSSVDLLGHSFGGVCAFGGVTRTSSVRRLVLYEGWPAVDPDAVALPADVEGRLDALLAEGKRESALEVFFREVVMMPEDEFSAYRALPAWQARIAAAHTLTREVTPAFDAEQAVGITVPTLLLIGEDSPDSITAGYETVAASLPDARVVVLEGQQHIAMDLVPEVFARHVVAFLREPR